jgi:hypothetical protein
LSPSEEEGLGKVILGGCYVSGGEDEDPEAGEFPPELVSSSSPSTTSAGEYDSLEESSDDEPLTGGRPEGPPLGIIVGDRRGEIEGEPPHEPIEEAKEGRESKSVTAFLCGTEPPELESSSEGSDSSDEEDLDQGRRPLQACKECGKTWRCSKEIPELHERCRRCASLVEIESGSDTEMAESEAEQQEFISGQPDPEEQETMPRIKLGGLTVLRDHGLVTSQDIVLEPNSIHYVSCHRTGGRSFWKAQRDRSHRNPTPSWGVSAATRHVACRVPSQLVSESGRKIRIELSNPTEEAVVLLAGSMVAEVEDLRDIEYHEVGKQRLEALAAAEEEARAVARRNKLRRQRDGWVPDLSDPVLNKPTLEEAMFDHPSAWGGTQLDVSAAASMVEPSTNSGDTGPPVETPPRVNPGRAPAGLSAKKEVLGRIPGSLAERETGDMDPTVYERQPDDWSGLTVGQDPKFSTLEEVSNAGSACSPKCVPSWSKR